VGGLGTGSPDVEGGRGLTSSGLSGSYRGPDLHSLPLDLDPASRREEGSGMSRQRRGRRPRAGLGFREGVLRRCFPFSVCTLASRNLHNLGASTDPALFLSRLGVCSRGLVDWEGRWEVELGCPLEQEVPFYVAICSLANRNLGGVSV